MNKTLKPAKRTNDSNGSTPKAKAQAGLMRMRDALANIVQLQRQLAKIPKHQQMLDEVLVAKLSVYEKFFPDLVDAFEQMAGPILAKQAGGRPAKDQEDDVAFVEAMSYFKRTGRDLSAEKLSRVVSKKLIDNDPIAYKKNVGWDTDVEDKAPRPYSRRTASDFLKLFKECRPHKE